MGTEQQFCLKWNNHRSTILSVFDTLLEEESLVDVTLTAEGQFLRAHKVILSACSPYFRIMFRAANEKHPVIYMQNVDFENLKALVEYMYKGEANVPQHMLPSFIRTAESLQIRGLAEGASHQYDSSDGSLPPPSHASTPQPLKEKKEKKALSPPPTSGILAARLAKMADHPNPLFNFATQRHPSLPHLPPPPLGNLQKKRRNTVDKDLSPIKQNKMNLHAKNGGLLNKSSNVLLPPPSLPVSSVPHIPSSGVNHSFIENDEEGDLKIDEDAGDLGKENRASPANNNNLSHSLSKTDPDEDIADLDANGVESEDEEPSMPAPGSTEMAPGGIINPWTGEDMSSVISDEHEENNSNNPSQRSGSSSGGDIHSMFPTPGGGSHGDNNSNLSRSDLEISRTPMEISGDAASSSQIGNTTTPSSSSFSGASNATLPSTTTPAVKYACSRCTRSYLHQATLVRHQRYECGISASYPCSLCGRKFKRRDVLKGHMEKCVNKSSFAAAAAAAAAAAINVSVSYPSQTLNS
ncbi:uncharacterized protein [Lepeophtheirus salmonis]|uniref:Uncharacterized protein n=1 Tax=Lepeophtheirus salmonis TaxID=72036 RepID=A0A0K2T1N3_LEPSM|nr:broad-complex core protein isoforms 1/2/3/4/5-like isoform X2 [Lepeophtheirus salmonis]